MTAQGQQDQSHGTQPAGYPPIVDLGTLPPAPAQPAQPKRRMTPLIGGVIGIALGAVLGVGGTLAVHGSSSTGSGTGAPSGQFPGGGQMRGYGAPGGGQMPNGGNGNATPPTGVVG
jgi:hypothetical protein